MGRLNKRQVGAEYEEQAVEYLKSKGYRIIGRNYRNRYGEIDIIAEDGDGVIVYCEIKFRRDNRYGEPIESVDFGKRKKICKAAMQHYIRSGYADEKSCRFDVIGFYGSKSVKHIKNAFEYQGE